MGLSELYEDFQDEAWLSFHGGSINEQDDYYTYLHEWIDNAVIYRHDCVKYLTNNEDYYFLEHDVYGRPNDIYQAAYACIYDYFINEGMYDLWAQMEEVLNED